MTREARRRREAGFTLLEMLVSTALILLVTGTVFSLLNPSYGTFQAQPEVADMQQRLRVAADAVQKDFVMAGAGTYSGMMAGTLDSYFAPILPHRVGTINPDPPGTFRANPLCPDTCASAVTIMYVPTTTAQTTIRDDMPNESAELKVETTLGGCPLGNNLCGFEQGMRVLIFDPSGAYDIFTITQVQDAALHLQHRDDKFTTTYQKGSWITQIESHTYYLHEDDAAGVYQLRHFDGYKSDLPLVDNVVDFRVEFFGDPLPPQIVKPVTEPRGPWTTYGPKPPALGVDNPADPWAAGENCIFHVDPGSGLQVARPEMATLGPGNGGLVQLTRAQLIDGPWCPSDKNSKGADMPNKYDADLLRVRQVRVTLRVQAANDLLRGPAGPLFRHGGRSTGGERFIPDQEIRFDVTPRNMNLGR
ncbi:MAG TPA: prepilin-type N-terminal cleavage/methylation domain-containing protein [Vicinamibacterales bacterium]